MPTARLYCAAAPGLIRTPFSFRVKSRRSRGLGPPGVRRRIHPHDLPVWRTPDQDRRPPLRRLEISFIRDYRYVRYVVDDAELALAPDAKPAGDGAAH